MSRDSRRFLALRTGGRVPLPLLVPSFSSKGFPTYKAEDTEREISETYAAFELVNGVLEESFLVSAFDLHHGFLPATPSHLTHSEVVFIDSGGYEISPFFDSTEPTYFPYPKRAFTIAEYRSVLEGFNPKLPLVITSPDWETKNKELAVQIATAQAFLAPFPFTKSFILKPGENAFVNVKALTPHIEDLNAFDVIGVTEKELGKNLADRLRAVADLRAVMDSNGLARIPIHVWGGLDPLITPLYAFAGAEIFDGLSWLRYAYHQGTAVYRDSKQVLESAVSASYKHRRSQLWFENLSELRRLAASLRMFRYGGRRDFTAFEWHGEAFRRAFEEIESLVPALQGGRDGR